MPPIPSIHGTPKHHRRVWKWLLGALGGLIVLAVLLAVQPWVYLPHERIVIRVPYSTDDVPTGLIPMGETINHPKPQTPSGHPGIDFGWEGEALHPVVASADGTVTSVTVGASHADKYDVEVAQGYYLLRYKEMESIAPQIHKGARVAAGDPVGQVGQFCDGGGAQRHCHSNLHWEFASSSLLRDRFCPMAYFDAPSRASIEAVWAAVPADQEMKRQFPEICSGDYAGKVE